MSQRNYEVKKSAYDMEVETARAEAELAFQLQVGSLLVAKTSQRKAKILVFPQAAKIQQRIKEEKMNIDIVDRVNQIDIEEKEIERRRKELQSRLMVRNKNGPQCTNHQHDI